MHDFLVHYKIPHAIFTCIKIVRKRTRKYCHSKKGYNHNEEKIIETLAILSLACKE